jgi:hypothetical protein
LLKAVLSSEQQDITDRNQEKQIWAFPLRNSSNEFYRLS